VAEALGVAAEGSNEQEAAVVEEDEEMEREDGRGVAKRPDLNELDVPEWAELALDEVEWRELSEPLGCSFQTHVYYLKVVPCGIWANVLNM
jgi:hypothetical protein